MDQPNDQQHAMSNDDELAKVLQGGLQFEETPVGGGAADGDAKTPDPIDTAAPSMAPLSGQPADPDHEESKPESDAPKPEISTHHKADAGSSDLDKLKASALDELRPLVKKLELPDEEKFDTLLLIIRSTDDQSLLQEAHEAAKNIADESKRAQALLDIIKEVDYFNTKK